MAYTCRDFLFIVTSQSDSCLTIIHNKITVDDGGGGDDNDYDDSNYKWWYINLAVIFTDFWYGALMTSLSTGLHLDYLLHSLIVVLYYLQAVFVTWW